MAKEVGKKQGKIGKGNPPKETQFKPGESGNPKGYPKGVPNRSTIALKVLKMKGKPPREILRNLEKMYPEFFKKKGEGWSNEFIATIRLAQKAIIKGDVLAYIAVMDSAYGKAKQSLKLGMDDEELTEMKIHIVRTKEDIEKAKEDIKNYEEGSNKHSGIPEESGPILKKRKKNPNKRGGNGKQQDGVPGPTDGKDNAGGKGKADNHSKKNPASPEGDRNEGLPEQPERTGGV